MAKKLTKRQQLIKDISEEYKGKQNIKDAVAALRKFSEKLESKFDQTIEFSVQLGIDTKANNQQVRASVTLPAGTGKEVKVCALAKGEKVNEAQEAGADFYGTEDIIKKISDGWMDFDVLVATPDCMPMLGKLGRVLGPRGLMPNPKDGTVDADIARAVKSLKAGKVGFRAEKTGAVVHMPIGKASFSDEDILKNLTAAVTEINKVKPSASKGTYMKSAFISLTQGPGIEISPDSAVAAV